MNEILAEIDCERSLAKNKLVFATQDLVFFDKFEKDGQTVIAIIMMIGLPSMTIYMSFDLINEGKYYIMTVLNIVSFGVAILVGSSFFSKSKLYKIKGGGTLINTKIIRTVSEKFNWVIMYDSRKMVIIDPTGEKKHQITILFDNADIRINSAFVGSGSTPGRMPVFSLESHKLTEQFQKEFKTILNEKI